MCITNQFKKKKISLTDKKIKIEKKIKNAFFGCFWFQKQPKEKVTLALSEFSLLDFKQVC